MRCTMDVGKRDNPASVAYELYRLIDNDEVYWSVLEQLTKIGIDLDGPADHVWWLDPPACLQFQARCSDAGAAQVGPADKQPRNYLITATITSKWGPWTARAELIHHDAQAAINRP